MLLVEKRWKPHFLRKEVKEKWIKDYVDRQTAVSGKWV
jgi:hypothetical protein